MLSRGRRQAACPQGGGAGRRTHSRKLGEEVCQSSCRSKHWNARLTVDIGARRERGVLGERIDNIMIGAVGIVVGLLGVVVILGRSAERHMIWILKGQPLSGLNRAR